MLIDYSARDSTYIGIGVKDLDGSLDKVVFDLGVAVEKADVFPFCKGDSPVDGLHKAHVDFVLH